MKDSQGRISVPIMFASFLAAVMMWGVVFTQTNPYLHRTIVVKLELNGLDSSRFAVIAPPRTIRLAVNASEDKLKELKDTPDLVAMVDVSSAQVGKQSYPVQIFPERFRDLLVDRAVFQRLESESVERRQVDVTVESLGQLSTRDLVLDDTLVVPPRVTVQGPKSQVDQVVTARARLELPDVDPNQHKSYTAEVNAVGEGGKPLPDVRTDPLFVRITPVINSAPEEKPVFVSPDLRGSVSDGYEVTGYRVEPDQVRVRGKSLALAGVTRVATQPIELGGLTASETVLTVLRLPVGVQLVKPQRVRVRIDIKRLKKILTVPTKPNLFPPLIPGQP